jgi:fatty acid synthase subunit alpha
MVKDEPVKDLLGNFDKALIQRLLERKYKSAVPTIDYLAVQNTKAVPKTLPGVTRTEVGNLVTFKFGSKLPETESWFQALAGSELIWLSALISSPTVVQDNSYVDNALRRILVPRAGQKVVVKYAGSLPLSVTVYGAARFYGGHIPTFKALNIIFNPETKLINLTLFEERQDVAIPLSLQFQYCPSQGFAPIHEIASGRSS